MRVLACLLLLLWLAVPAASQEKEKWERVYTFEDGTIAINTAKVEFGDAGTARVRFRWNWSKMQSLDGAASATKYKARVEVQEFMCARRRYRLAEFMLYDEKGKLVFSKEADPAAIWKFVKPGSMMERLFGPACQLINEKQDER